MSEPRDDFLGGAADVAPGGARGSEWTDPAMQPEPEPPPRPAFFKRFGMVFFSPGTLFEQLAPNPAWFVMALVATLVGTAGWFALVPADALSASFMEQMRTGGTEMPPEALASMQSVPPSMLKFGAALGALVVGVVIPVAAAALSYVIFVFIRGDRGGFKQHLCVFAHGAIVWQFGSIVTAFVHGRHGRIAETLSLGDLFPFLPDGYVASVLGALEFFTIWYVVVAGIGLATLDKRRDAGSTVGILLGLLLVTALIRGALG